MLEWLSGPKYELICITLFVCFGWILFTGLLLDGAFDHSE